MPGPGPGKTLTPIRLKGRDQTLFRYLSRSAANLPGSSTGGMQWASCVNHVSSPFRRDIHVDKNWQGNIYLSNSDLGLLGLGALVVGGSLAIAYTGVASAWYLVSEGVVVSSQSLGLGLGASGIGGLFGAAINPTGPQFTNFNKPCSENAGVAF
jgi:hypothetical protein